MGAQSSNINTHKKKHEQRSKKTHEGANTRLESSRKEEQNKTRDDAISRKWKGQDREITCAKKQNNIRANKSTGTRDVWYRTLENGGIRTNALLTERTNRSASGVTRPQANAREREH